MAHDLERDLPDETLLSCIARGDVDALGVLFRRRQQNVYRFVLHLTGSPSMADDVTQDVFVAVIRDASRYDASRAAVVAWLCGIARNFVRRRLSVDRGAASHEADQRLGAALHAAGPDPLADLTSAESIESLRRAVLSLPLRYREAVVLCDLTPPARSIRQSSRSTTTASRSSRAALRGNRNKRKLCELGASVRARHGAVAECGSVAVPGLRPDSREAVVT